MISSMTGFGEASAEVDGVVYTVEIKTVNNRYVKIHLRMPEIVSFLEMEVEGFLRKRIRRGMVNCSIRMKNVSGQALFDVDANALNGYLIKLKDLARSNEIDYKIDLAEMLTLPGIVQPAVPAQEQAEKMKTAILELVGQAVEKLKQMRAREGAMLVEDLTANCKLMGEKLKLIRQRSPAVVKEYHEKLEKRTRELLATGQLQIDAEIIARETVIFADRCDIAEELTRLESHLHQFTTHCQSDQNAGRKLDFISQEMLREANTIASKASDAQISQWVIDVKCAIERIKEQVQNIE
jgi:uncharacterized protein (TIGR00255 family)